MQLQSTLLFLTTLLAATSALPDSQPEKYEVSEQAIYPGITAKIRGWAKQNCPASDRPSYYKKVVQQKCYSIPKTEFLSYKLWQPTSTPAGWDCTFTLYDDATCTGFYVAPDSLPSIEKKATCDDGLRSYGDNGQIDGFGSFRFTCACIDFYGCTIPFTH